MTAPNEFTAKQIALELHAAGLGGESFDRINGWLVRGDGVAVYENVELGHPQLGHRQYVSFGGPAAQLEVDKQGALLRWEYNLPPDRLPDIGSAINWRYRLVGWYRGPMLEVPAEWRTPPPPWLCVVCEDKGCEHCPRVEV